jgi:ketosteroid isomerase-like protein
VLATAGAAVVETVVTNVEGYTGPLKLPLVQLLIISDGRITHLEVYGNDERGSQVARPRPVGTKPGPADDAAAVEGVVTAYYAALENKDVAGAAALYSPQVIFQDTTRIGPAGSIQAAIDGHTGLAAVPDWSLELKSVIGGDGWAVAGWVLSGTSASGDHKAVPGATVFEVRDGKIVRQTLYYVRGGSPFGS